MSCGVVSTPDYEELVVLTYSGRVVSFTSRPVDRKDETDLRGTKTVKQARAEVDHQDAQGRTQGAPDQGHPRSTKRCCGRPAVGGGRAAATRSRTAVVVVGGSSAALVSSGHGQVMHAPQQFSVKTRMELVPDEAAYVLSVEIPLPLDMVTLTSTVRLDLLDTDGSQAIVSVSPASPEHGKAVLATFRFQENVSRAEIRYRTAEGESGDVVLGVVATLEPKMSQVTRVTIKPLSLHHRVHSLQSIVAAEAAAAEARSKFGDLNDVDPSAPAAGSSSSSSGRRASRRSTTPIGTSWKSRWVGGWVGGWGGLAKKTKKNCDG